ncbi:MAG: aminotransferase class V-fold PLP-dependent enzyme [Microbacterium sp.]
MIDRDALERHFPHRPGGYFDQAAVGTAPHEVSVAVAGVAEALSRGTQGSAAWHELTDRALELLSIDLGVDAERLIVLGNTSEAINAAARAIRFEPGQCVLTFSDDFPSPRLPWTTLAEVAVREIAPGDGDERTDVLIDAIDESTRVVSVTHVHASTGTVVDLERVAEACHQVGALLVVDGAQSAGVLAGSARHADVYVGASYKWLLAGFGAAVVATSVRFDAEALPRLRGYMNLPPSPRLAVGHSNLYGLAALQASAEVRHEIGLSEMRAHTRAVVAALSDGITSLGYTTASAHAGAGILSVDIRDGEALAAELRERGLSTALRGGRLRLSPSFTTTDRDVERLLDALDTLAPAHRA